MADTVTVVPDVSSVYKDILVPIGKHGEMVMVSFIKDEFHFARQMAVFFVIFKDDVPEIYFYPDRTARFDVLHFSTLKGTAEEFNVRGVYELAFEAVAGAFFLHYVNVERFHEQTDFPSGFETVIVLHHEFVALIVCTIIS